MRGVGGRFSHGVLGARDLEVAAAWNTDLVGVSQSCIGPQFCDARDRRDRLARQPASRRRSPTCRQPSTSRSTWRRACTLPRSCRTFAAPFLNRPCEPRAARGDRERTNSHALEQTKLLGERQRRQASPQGSLACENGSHLERHDRSSRYWRSNRCQRSASPCRVRMASRRFGSSTPASMN